MKLKKNIRYDLIYLLILLMIFSFATKANEVKIVSKIGNEIITNIDVENEYNYLITLNTSLKDVDKNQVILFAQNSLIKEKIKKNEISKFYELNNKNETVDSMIKNIYKSLGLNDKNQFQSYLNNNNLKFDEVYKKLEIESVWNQMIYQKFRNKIFINEDELRKKISNNQKEIETFLLSEIVVSIKNKNEINKKYNELIENINTLGFKESVLKFSISNSKSNSGSLGWINKNNLSKIIQNELDKIKVGEITKPVLISSGILILKLENRKFIEPEQDLDIELKKLIDYEMNSQLNNFSTIYYNKIKKNFL
jgi:peptidyl-prolyl cis-trans isomerase SurA